MLGRIPTRFSMDAISLLFFFFFENKSTRTEKERISLFLPAAMQNSEGSNFNLMESQLPSTFLVERERNGNRLFSYPLPPRGFTISFLHYRPMRLSGFSLIGSTTEKREREKQSRALLKSTISIVASLSVRPNVTGVLLKRERVHFRSRRQNCKRGSNKKKGDVQAPIELPLSA